MNGSQPPLYGLLGEFPGADPLITASRRCRQHYSRLEAFSPFPLPALDSGHDRVAPWALGGALIGALMGFLVQYYSIVHDYPLNIGGRPLFSWPALLPITIILSLFWGALGTVVGLLVLNRLPRLYHPVFNAGRFSAASRDGYFLLIRADDPHFDRDRIQSELLELGAVAVEKVWQ